MDELLSAQFENPTERSAHAAISVTDLGLAVTMANKPQPLSLSYLATITELRES
jgi:hypothetical protein